MLDNDLLNIFPGAPAKISSPEISFKKNISAETRDKLVNFIKSSLDSLSKIGLDKLKVGLSGGLDSSIACSLLKLAVGNRAEAIIVDLSENKTSEDSKSSESIAKTIGLPYRIIKAGSLYMKQLEIEKPKNSIAKIHLRTRFVNNLIFQTADNDWSAVIDTTDRSEKITGRFAEAFYGHISPLISFYKSELVDLAKILELPEEVYTKEPGCPDLLDIDAFGVNWKILDQILYMLVDEDRSIKDLTSQYNIDKAWLKKLADRLDKQSLRYSSTVYFD